MIQLERTAQLWGISGNLGGGKSLTAVQFAVDAMSMGYFVCSNISLRMDVVAAHYGQYTRKLYQHISLDDPKFDPFKLPCGSPRGSRGKKRVLVILDECAEWVDQYSSAKDPRIARLWSWLRHSSKRSQDVFIIVQRREYLNKVIRILVSRWIWVNDLAVYRLPVLRCRFPFCGGLVMRNIYDISDRRIRPVSFASKSYWGRFYNTAECLNADGSTYNLEYEVPERKSHALEFLFLLLILSQIVLYRALYLVPRVSVDPAFQELSSPFDASARILPGMFFKPQKTPLPRFGARMCASACAGRRSARARLGLFLNKHCVQGSVYASSKQKGFSNSRMLRTYANRSYLFCPPQRAEGQEICEGRSSSFFDSHCSRVGSHFAPGG